MKQLNPGVALALAKRDLRRYFLNPSGYVFVTVFLFLSAAAAFWQPRFFLNNLANLDQLNQVFPYLILLFVPALCMGAWSEERKLGTDELLLTLPATEWELVLGKYLAGLGIYTSAILLSAGNVVLLEWLGDPDPGLMLANYIGYWLAGAALIPGAMLGSLLTINPAIAFMLGALFCALPVGLGAVASVFSESLGRSLAPFGLPYHLGDFTRGAASAVAPLYFAVLAGLVLHLNVLVLLRRNWTGVPRHRWLWIHHLARTIALAAVLASAGALVARIHGRVDLTAERLHTLAPDTRMLVGQVTADRPVVIQAFVSPTVPGQHVQTRENLIGILRQIDGISGPEITAVIQETEAFSPSARLARERHGIVSRQVADPYTGSVSDVYLGVAVTGGTQEEVIPFFEPGLSIEYEIARAIRVVSRVGRKRVGVLDTDVRILGGIDFRTNEVLPAWGIVPELRKQYDVVEVTPATVNDARLDALLAVLPTRLTQGDLDLMAQRINGGTPTLIVLDPLPLVDMRLAPAAQIAAQMDPYRPAQPSQMNFGNVRQLLADLGMDWVPGRIAWDGHNPHPDMSQLPQETVFVANGNGNPEAFNLRHPATSGLQEVMLLYPGYLLPVDSAHVEVEPLLQTGTFSGSSSFFDVVRPSATGLVLNQSLSRNPDERRYVLATHVRTKVPGSTAAAQAAPRVNAIVVADLDFISDYFFTLRAAAPPNANFDNIRFFLNALDVLAGDESFIALRNKRLTHRTLERVSTQTTRFLERRTKEEQQAEREARTALDAARGRLANRIQEVEKRHDLDPQAKRIMIRNIEEAETRRFQVLERTIALDKGAKIQASRATMEDEIRRIRGTIRVTAVVLPPVPILLFGIAMFVRRQRRQRAAVPAGRRLQEIT